jgi:predicted anti-sigma-YlaC factor YlaD
VNCTAVRDALPEFALGVAARDDVSSVELHVDTCAACRKEAIDLQRAAAAFGYALSPIETPVPELEERVVGTVRSLARRSHPSARGRRSGIVLLAAAVIVASIGVGSVFAGREAQQAAEVDRQAAQNTDIVGRFGSLFPQYDPDARFLTGLLAPVADRGNAGAGAAMTVVSPSIQDRLLVIVNGLRARRLPLSVSVSDTKGHVFDVGEIKRFDSDGGAQIARIVGGSLKGFIDVEIRDTKGHLVLRGTLAPTTNAASPSP